MESFESLLFWMRNFDHCGPRLNFFACKGFIVQSKPMENFLSSTKIDLKFSGKEFSFHSFITVIHFSRAIKLYKPFYKIISRNYELCKFWSIDFSSCFDFSYFQSPESESSCHASHCELSKCFPTINFSVQREGFPVWTPLSLSTTEAIFAKLLLWILTGLNCKRKLSDCRNLSFFMKW